METITRERVERSFVAFSDRGEFITHDTYVGQAYNLARSSGQELDSPKVTRMVDELERLWVQFATAADTDNDGKIDQDDYMVFAEGMTAMLSAVGPEEEWPLDPYIRTLFDVIDADSDGSITRDEYANWLSSMGLDADTDIDGAFAALDDNGDGKLSWEEFSECSRQYWTSPDPNVPGTRWMGP